MLTETLVNAIVQGGAIGVAAGLIVLLGLLIVNSFQRDQRESRERERLIALLGTVLTNQAAQFQTALADTLAEVREEFERGMKLIATQTQNNFTAVLAQMIQDTDQRMADVTAAREKRLDALQTDVQTVPAETVRLLGPVIDDLRELIATGLLTIDQVLGDRLNKLGATVTPSVKRMIQQEIQQVRRRFDVQLDNLERLIVAVRADVAAARTSPPDPLSRQAGEGEQKQRPLDRG